MLSFGVTERFSGLPFGGAGDGFVLGFTLRPLHASSSDLKSVTSVCLICVVTVVRFLTEVGMRPQDRLCCSQSLRCHQTPFSSWET